MVLYVDIIPDRNKFQGRSSQLWFFCYENWHNYIDKTDMRYENQLLFSCQ